MLRAEEFDKTPGMLQVAKLKTKLRDSKIYVGDIEAGAEWKTKKADWWDQHGAQLVIRIHAHLPTAVSGRTGPVLPKLPSMLRIAQGRVGGGDFGKCTSHI